MFSFIVHAAGKGQDTNHAIDQAKDVTLRLVPSLGCSVKISQRSIPEINGGWSCFYPEEVPPAKRTITEYVDKDIAVLVFGDLQIQQEVGIAETIATVWRNGGITQVRNLDGCFSAVIVDRQTKSLYVVSDLLGLRTLTYFHNQDSLLISPHDVPIVATGLCPVEYDLESAASLLACDWSINGKPLLKNLNICNPNEYLVWKNGQLEKVYKPILLTEDRLEPGDAKGRDALVDQMIEKMRSDAKRLASDNEEVRIELTAGMDSRCVTAILLSVIESDRICAMTGGVPEDFEVRTAKMLAEQYRFHHTNFTPNAQDAEAFIPHSRLLAFFTNGTGNSKRSARPVPRINLDSPLTFIGNGGEIYHGFYYPSPLRKRPVEKYTTDDISSYMRRKLPLIQKLRWRDPNMVNVLQQRLDNAIEYCCRISSKPADIFNLLYMYERYCRWGSRPPRSVWAINRPSLFHSPALAKLAWRLPSPMPQNCILHRTAIKKFMPRSYHKLINRSKYMPLFDHPKISKAFAEGMIRLDKMAKAAQARFGSGERKSHEMLVGDIFSSDLADTLRDMILSKNSLTREIIDKDSLESILNNHISGKANNIHIIGFMATLEQWKNLIKEAKSLGFSDIGSEKVFF